MPTRREFVEFTLATIVAAGLDQPAWSAQTTDRVPYCTLGRTGVKVSMVGIGGYHLGKPNVEKQESIRIIRTALDEGINFLDNCWDYNGGESEIRMGQALRDGYREKAFLMTKIDGCDSLPIPPAGVESGAQFSAPQQRAGCGDPGEDPHGGAGRKV